MVTDLWFLVSGFWFGVARQTATFLVSRLWFVVFGCDSVRHTRLWATDYKTFPARNQKPETRSRKPETSRLLRTTALLAGAFIALTSASGCASRGDAAKASSKSAPAQVTPVENLTRRPISDIPQITRVVDSAIQQTRQTFEYDPSYAKLDYPNGDVPLERGVCADVIVRAFRSAGIDLQKEIHEDMVRHFSAYPAKWGARKPDSNIDHRRVPNLMTLFERKTRSAPITRKPSDYVPGDVVAWELDNHLLHIGLVTDAVSGGTQNYLVVHNIGAGAKLEDVLMAWKIIGHFRMWK